MRAVVLLAVAFVAAACGSTKPSRSARAQVRELGWHENCGTRANPFLVDTRRLSVDERRWRVELALRNETGIALHVIRPHAVGETLFGLAPFATTSQREILKRAETAEAKPRAFAERFSPAAPRLLEPGEGWSGSFSGRGPLPAEAPIRVVLGRFVFAGSPPRGFPRMFLCVSKPFVRLRP